MLTLWEVADGALAPPDRSLRARRRRAPRGLRRNPTFQTNPLWRDMIPFYEYFNGDTGDGLGASHQTGWTALVAKLIQQHAEYCGPGQTPVRPELSGMTDAIELSAVDFGRTMCGDLAEAERREWLVTNGIGGYASGNDRRNADAPLSRAARCIASNRRSSERCSSRRSTSTCATPEATSSLGANRWQNDYVAPQGWLAHRTLLSRRQRCRSGTTRVADGLLEKRVWMEHGRIRRTCAIARCAPTAPIDVDAALFRQLSQFSRQHARRRLAHRRRRRTRRRTRHRVRRRAPVLDRRRARHGRDRKRVVSRLRAFAGDARADSTIATTISPPPSLP